VPHGVSSSSELAMSDLWYFWYYDVDQRGPENLTLISHCVTLITHYLVFLSVKNGATPLRYHAGYKVPREAFKPVAFLSSRDKKVHTRVQCFGKLDIVAEKVTFKSIRLYRSRIVAARKGLDDYRFLMVDDLK